MKLPRGWVMAPLMDLIDLHDRYRIPLNQTVRQGRSGPYPYYGANGQVDSIDEYIFDGDFILLAEDGGHFDNPARGVAYEVTGKFWVNNHAHVLSTKADIPRRFLTHLLNSINWSQYVGGSTRLKLTQAGMRKIVLPLPPLAEQNRIAIEIENKISHTKAARKELCSLSVLIESYKRGLLSSAINGELSRDWREDKNINSHWQRVRLGAVVEDFSYGSSAKSSKQGDIPVLRMGNIKNGELDWSDLVFTSDINEVKKYRLSEGDVLFNRTNSPDLVGKTALYKGEREAIYAGYLIRIRCSEHLDPAFLTYCLNSPLGREYCLRVKSDAISQSNINAKKLEAFELPLPSIDEQKEIALRVSRRLDTVARIAAEYQRAKQLLDKIEQSIIAKAFRGELVAQDPEDEPAAVLLERIREEQNQETPISQQVSLGIRADRAKHVKKGQVAMSNKKRSDVSEEHLSELLRQLGGTAEARDLWQQSEMHINEFYKLLRDEVNAGRIVEGNNEGRLEARDAA